MKDNETKQLIHIFSINCQIHVDIINCDNCEDLILIKIIDNDTYSLRLSQNNDDIKNRKCPIVINSMSDEIYNITVEEHNPTIFYFDDNLQNINLNYNLNNFEDDSYVVFSFIFNEEATFEINIDDIEFNKKRIISNSHNFKFS